MLDLNIQKSGIEFCSHNIYYIRLKRYSEVFWLGSYYKDDLELLALEFDRLAAQLRDKYKHESEIL